MGNSQRNGTRGTGLRVELGDGDLPAGVTSQTVTVTIVGDRTPEPDESFRVVLGGTAGVVLGDASAEGRIVNDDASGGPVRRRLRRGL